MLDSQAYGSTEVRTPHLVRLVALTAFPADSKYNLRPNAIGRKEAK